MDVIQSPVSPPDSVFNSRPSPSPTIDKPLLPGEFTDAQLVEMFEDWKKESMDQRWVFERQWMRNIWYVLNRAWIYYDSRRGQWQDKRLAKWVPRPSTPICKEVVQTIRANFTAIKYAASARPIGNDPVNVAVAGVADDYMPVLHETHQMNTVMKEFDFSLLTFGNAFLHTCVEYDRKNGMATIDYEECQQCFQSFPNVDIANAGQKCPECGGTTFQPSVDEETGQPKQEQKPLPAGTTIALTPFEIAFPLTYTRFKDLPYIIRMRWREKRYYEQHAELKGLVSKISWQKSPTDRTMQIFKTLPFQNDLGMTPSYYANAGNAQSEGEGVSEYDVWIKPCGDFPDGQVIRFCGDKNPIVLHLESEGLPGPLPYTEADGTPMFPFAHAEYEHVGGRILGSGPLDPIIQKVDQLNQLDSLILMIIMRMANPIWLEPKGAEVEKFTGEPGLVVKWNPLVAGGNAKPERIPGQDIPQTLMAYRELLKREIEEEAGTSDIFKGQKPAGVEAFSALNLLVERGQARHSNAFQSRGDAYKSNMKVALEIEREFGPEKRFHQIASPTRGWTMQTFKKADLGGAYELVVEDSTLTPKTSLGERAAIEHLQQLQLLDPADSDQKYTIFKKFGQTALVPALDAQVQEALMNMQRFEQALSDPQLGAQIFTPEKTPLRYKRWYNPQVHRQELIKWCVSDAGRGVFEKFPAAEMVVDQYLTQIDLAIAQTMMGIMDANGIQVPTAPQPGGPTGEPGAPAPTEGQPATGAQGPPKQPAGAGGAMANSNRNSAGAGSKSSSSIGTSAPGKAAA